jgi:hypothetical protein
LIPAPDGGDDLIGIRSADERFGIVVGFGKEAFGGGLEINIRRVNSWFH